MPNFIKYIIAFALISGIGLSIYFISAGDLGPRESALLSTILTILSVLATWVITHIYTQSQHKKNIEEVQKAHLDNLRTYALKAAEKVNNLSTQLNRLAAYLEESFEYDETTDIHDTLLVNQQRIESAIHTINILKSVNDTALSDWEGVIGDELSKQREKQAEKEQELAELIDKLEDITASQIDTQIYAQDSTETLSREMESMRRDIRSMASSLGLTPVRLTKSVVRGRKARVHVSNACPECGQQIEYRQKEDVRSVKKVKCKACDAELIATYNPDEKFILQKRILAQEQVACPACETPTTVELDTYPNSSLVVECTNCHAQLIIKRTYSGVTTNIHKPSPEPKQLTDEILELVKNNLPPQPWPEGTSRDVAEKLGLPRSTVSAAIAKLIRNGVFDVQYYGKLYVPKSQKSKAKVNDSQEGEGQTNKS